MACRHNHQIGASIFIESAGPLTHFLPLCLCLCLSLSLSSLSLSLSLSLSPVLLLYLFLCLYSCLIHGNKHIACWHNHQIGGSNFTESAVPIYILLLVGKSVACLVLRSPLVDGMLTRNGYQVTVRQPYLLSVFILAYGRIFLV